MISDKDISICLIEPLYPINVGYVARIMKNFGFDKFPSLLSLITLPEIYFPLIGFFCILVFFYSIRDFMVLGLYFRVILGF